MSKVTSVPLAGADKLTVKVAVVVPEFPSTTVTSLIVRSGVVGALQLFTGEALLRGFGAKTKKSAALLLVSVQPPASRKSAVVLLGAGAGPDPSKQKSVVEAVLP